MTDVTSATDIKGAGTALNAGDKATITIEWPNAVASAWQLGETYYFRIVPNPGQFLELQEQAPVQ